MFLTKFKMSMAESISETILYDVHNNSHSIIERVLKG